MTVAASRPCLAEVRCHNYQLKVQLYFNGRDFTNLCIVAMAVAQIAYSIDLCPVAMLYKQYRFCVCRTCVSALKSKINQKVAIEEMILTCTYS